MRKTMTVPRLMILVASAAVATLALVVVASGNLALAASSVVNGNFETGDLSGWDDDTTNGGTASAVTSYDYYYIAPPETCGWGPCYTPATIRPEEGFYFALLTAGNRSDYTKLISEPFTVSKGDKVSGWAFFYNTDGWASEDSKAQVLVKSASGTTIGKAFEESVSSVGYYGYSGWKYWEYPFIEEGEFQIEARVGGADVYAGTSMGLDDVKTGINDAPADNTQPSTSATRSVQPNADGWNKEDVTVKLNATDNEGGWGVRDITYRLNGGEPTTEVGDSVEVPVTTEDETTLAYYATDKAGNAEDEQSLEVKIDKTPPKVATNSASPADTATPSATISIRFLESGSGIKLSSLNNYGFEVYKESRFTGTERVSGTTSYDPNSQTATFTPSRRLGKGTYYAWVNAWYVRDKAENVLADTYTWRFSVG